MTDDAAPTIDNVMSGNTVKDSTPRLHPAPGRCIVRIVPRLLQARTSGGIDVELDGRYENQPMLGYLHEIGGATNEREAAIKKWAEFEAAQQHLFVFSMYNSGSPYWDDEMRKMLPTGYDFRWLQGFRLFDIGQLATTISGSWAYGERVAIIEAEPALELVS